MTNRVAEKGSIPGAVDREGERGLALLVVLWIVVASVLLVVTFSATVRSGAIFVASEVELAKSEALVDAGAEIAATRLIDETAERRWLADGKPHRVLFGGAELTIAIEDPNGLIDLNKTSEKILLPFLAQFTGSEMRAGQIRDLILNARDEAAGKPAGSAAQRKVDDDDDDRRRKKAPSPAFMDVAQLRRVEGVGAEVYDKIAPFLTVYSDDGRINPRGAPDQVLAAIPNLTRIDIDRVRDAVRSGRENDPAVVDVMQRARSSLSDKRGTAFVVSVAVRRADDKFGAAKVFVIALGVDKDAPYRVIAKKPVNIAVKVP